MVRETLKLKIVEGVAIGLVSGVIVALFTYWLNLPPVRADIDVVIKTSAKQDAGTDGSLTLIINNVDGRSDRVMVSGGSGENDKRLERGLKTEEYFSEVLSGGVVSLELQFIPEGRKPGWLPEWVTIKNRQTGEVFCFQFGGDGDWLSHNRARSRIVPKSLDLAKCK